MTSGRVILASARLPVTLVRRQDSWEVTPSPGGLATGLRAVADDQKLTWFGLPGPAVPEEDRDEVARDLRRRGCVPLFVTKAQLDGFYESFSNGVLWPLFHNLANRSNFDLSGFKAYEQVNERFANAIAELAKPSDLVWVHDYQLALLPELLRRRGLKCPIGFFLHIPFPSAETYRTLPHREQILRGMLGADLLGFHTYEYLSHFRGCCLRVLGVESDLQSIRLPGRRVQLAAIPIGVDPEEVRRLSTSREAREQLATLERTYSGQRIVVSADRLDYTKGVPEKLRAFEELLRKEPKWRGRVVLIQVGQPTRTGVGEYRDLKRQVDELVGRINGRFGTPSWMPVVYVTQNMPRERIFGLYQAGDVALVTPLRDGMNLVALEYVLARGELGGALILSEFAGAAHWLAGARLVNPYQMEGVAEVLGQTLEHEHWDPEGFKHMLRFATENSAARWAGLFLSQLEETRSEARPTAERLALDEPPLSLRVRDARRPLLLFDYDGTLRSFENDPRAATPGSRLHELLARLSECATVYIVSGRTAETLDAWFGGLGIGLVCEHGLMIKAPGGAWRRRAQLNNEQLRRLVEPLFRDFVRRTPGSSIELKSAGIAWHYRAAEPEFGAFQANLMLTLLEDMLKRRPYTVLPGARVIEVRHQSVSKGRALKQLLRRHRTSDLLFCAGDDRTDEEMMAAIPDTWRARAVSCWVGSRSGRARYWVESSAAFLEQLEAFLRLRSGRRKLDDGARRAGDGASPSSPHAAVLRGAGARLP